MNISRNIPASNGSIIFFFVVGASAYTIFFKNPHKKKFEFVKSGDLGHYALDP